MGKICYWGGVYGKAEDLEECKKAIDQLRAGEYKSGNFKRLKGHKNIWSMRLNQKRRALFITFMSKEGIPQLFVTPILENHKYDTWHFLRKGVLDHYLDINGETLSNSITDEDQFEEALPPDLFFNNEKEKEKEKEADPLYEFKTLHYQNQTFIELSDEQNQALVLSPPLVIRGEPGSGKTCLAFALIEQTLSQHHLTGKETCIYVAQEPRLAKAMQAQWEKHPFSKTPGGKQVKFLYYNEMLAAIEPLIYEKGFQLVDDLEEWLNQHYIPHYRKQKKLKTNNLPIVEESFLKQSQKMVKECRILAAYSNSEYMDLGQKQCIFHDKNEKEWMWLAFKQYEKHLEKSKLINPAFHVPPMEKPYYMIIADETQDFSCLQAKILRFLSPNTYFCFDPTQSCLDDISKSIFLYSLPGANNGTLISHIELPKTYRCPLHVVNVCNIFLDIKRQLNHGIGDKLEYINMTASPEQEKDPGQVSWLEDLNDVDLQALRKSAQGTDFAVVTLKEHKEEMALLFDTDLVYTPEEIKGQEYPTIFIYKLFDTNEWKEANKQLDKQSQQPQKEYRHRAKRGEYNQDFSHIAGQVIAAFTRAKVHLIICQKSTRDLRHVLSPLKAYSEGCDLCLMSKLPESLAEYKNSYIFLKDNDIQELYYIKPDGVEEKVQIDDFDLFNEKINALKKRDEAKLHLCKEKLEEIITSNGGHTRSENISQNNLSQAKEASSDKAWREKAIELYQLGNLSQANAICKNKLKLSEEEARKLLLGEAASSQSKTTAQHSAKKRHGKRRRKKHQPVDPMLKSTPEIAAQASPPTTITPTQAEIKTATPPRKNRKEKPPLIQTQALAKPKPKLTPEAYVQGLLTNPTVENLRSCFNSNKAESLLFDTLYKGECLWVHLFNNSDNEANRNFLTIIPTEMNAIKKAIPAKRWLSLISDKGEQITLLQFMCSKYKTIMTLLRLCIEDNHFLEDIPQEAWTTIADPHGKNAKHYPPLFCVVLYLPEFFNDFFYFDNHLSIDAWTKVYSGEIEYYDTKKEENVTFSFKELSALQLLFSRNKTLFFYILNANKERFPAKMLYKRYQDGDRISTILNDIIQPDQIGFGLYLIKSMPELFAKVPACQWIAPLNINLKEVSPCIITFLLGTEEGLSFLFYLLLSNNDLITKLPSEIWYNEIPQVKIPQGTYKNASALMLLMASSIGISLLGLMISMHWELAWHIPVAVWGKKYTDTQTNKQKTPYEIGAENINASSLFAQISNFNRDFKAFIKKDLFENEETSSTSNRFFKSVSKDLEEKKDKNEKGFAQNQKK